MIFVKLFFVLMTTIFVIVVDFLYLSLIKKRAVCIYRISGKVIDLIKKKIDRQDGTQYYPVVEYYYDNIRYEKVSNISYGKNGLKLMGTRIDIKINPTNPEEVLLFEKTQELLIKIFGGVAGIFLIISAILIVLF